MCGIFGYIGKRNAAKIVYDGLKRLEYRGYDSAGIGVLHDGKISVVKRRGRVGELAPHIAGLKGNIAIGHTRWATHGKPSDINAHPHSSGGITIVHNGIIENYLELKKTLEDSGETFLSETDSEVIACLVKRRYSGDIAGAIQKTVKLLKGSYALMGICEDGQKIVVAKQKSSVIIGFGEGENFCASDEPALAGLCGEICSLEDGDIAVMTAENVEIFDGELQPVTRQKRCNEARAAALRLYGCPHYMLKELREVPYSIANTAKAFSGVRHSLSAALEGVDRIIIVGCGTAYHAGLIGKRYFELFARTPCEAENAGEFRYKEPVVTENTAVFAVSQSGETADTVEAATLATSVGAKVIAVTNAPYSRLTRIADVVVPVAAGSEICVAATKSYTGQIAALYLSALTFAGGEEFDMHAGKLAQVSALCSNVIKSIDIFSLAHLCARSRGVYFLGRDLDYAVALEGSLKLKEVSYIPGEGYPAGELKHGTLALIDEDTVSVVLITDKDLADKSKSAVEQVLSRGGKAAVITNIRTVAEELKGGAEIINLPQFDRLLSPLLAAVAVQELAYRTAVILGRDPDKPRNLAKSVTVE